MRIDKNTTIRLGDRNIVKVKLGDVVIWQKSTEPVVGPDYFYIESLGDGNTISVVNRGNGNTSGVTPTLEYSTDKNTWNTITFDWTSGTHTTELPIKLNTGGKMYFRNNTGKFSNDYNKYISFSSSVSSNVGGDIRTLSNYLDVDNETKPQSNMFYYLFYNNKKIVDASNLRLPYTTLAIGCYINMFYRCTTLTSAPTLPATTLADYCYDGMFQDCGALTTAPELPATTLAIGCYSTMFKGCTSLTSAPTLPATTLKSECYSIMFSGCTSLTSAPTLPATTLKSNCYYEMFQGCSKLTTAPTLPATTLADNCYYEMFNGCTSLTTAPELPATTLADNCYSYMFQGCSKLTTAPTLPATTLVRDCYQYMFQFCSSLNYIKCLALNNSPNTNDFRNNCEGWVNGVFSSGTFISSDFYSQGWYWGNDGVPKNWTTKTESGNPFEPSSGGGNQIYQSGGLTVYEMGIDKGGYNIQVNSNVMEVPGFQSSDYCFAMMKISSDQGYGMTASMTPYIGNGVTVYISNEVNDDNNCPFHYNVEDESNNVSYSLTSSDSATQISPYINSGNCIWVKFVKNKGTYESDYPSISMNF